MLMSRNLVGRLLSPMDEFGTVYDGYTWARKTCTLWSERRGLILRHHRHLENRKVDAFRDVKASTDSRQRGNSDELRSLKF